MAAFELLLGKKAILEATHRYKETNWQHLQVERY